MPSINGAVIGGVREKVSGKIHLPFHFPEGVAEADPQCDARKAGGFI